MPETERQIGKTNRLRQIAEEMAEKRKAVMTPDFNNLSPEEVQKVFHELSVHQIELEMQNEELCAVRAELEAARARYFDLYNQAPAGYLTVNDQGIILESNQTAATMLGTTVLELKNQPLSNWIVFEDQDIFYHHRMSVYGNDRPQACELRMKSNAGSAVDKTIWVRLESLLQSRDNPVFRVIVSDITEKVRLTTQVHQAQKLETIGMLAGGVAHDYNNKLAVIIGYAELALNNALPPQSVQMFLEEILKAAQLSAFVTRQLLTIARKQPVSPVVIDLNMTIENLLRMLKQAVGTEIELIWRPAASLLPVKIDPVQIDQILLNLCMNARVAISDRGRITIETKNTECDAAFCGENAESREGKYVMLAMSDTGCGMSKETLSHIFEPFFTTKEVNQGTGLGLTTVEAIVKQNNGFIRVATEPGAGTTFTIFFPAFAAVTAKPGKQKQIMLSVQGETALVVEDEPSLLPLIKMMLETIGYSVLTASSPRAALDLAEGYKNEINLLLTDIMMPEMNGFVMAEAMKKLLPITRILFMSGYSSNVLAQKGFLNPDISFIQKPFTLADLAEKIKGIPVSESGFHEST
ncbi:MAG TPA: ATP-binding protein [Candidatus Rifleibacterium sp.]|nr:ATP-binding protein [Candidatus Rifleibacterium sp.]